MRKFTAEQVETARRRIAQKPPEDIDPRIENLVNELIGRVADKWTMLILDILAEKGELRFTRLGEFVGGISQKMLTQTLRQMERDGLVTRTVHPVDSTQGGIQADRLGDEPWRRVLRRLDMGFAKPRPRRRRAP